MDDLLYQVIKDDPELLSKLKEKACEVVDSLEFTVAQKKKIGDAVTNLVVTTCKQVAEEDSDLYQSIEDIISSKITNVFKKGLVIELKVPEKG
jgi:hypothetical protein